MVEHCICRADVHTSPALRPSFLAVAQVLHIALQVARALAYLHPTIIHRDLKVRGCFVRATPACLTGPESCTGHVGPCALPPEGRAFITPPLFLKLLSCSTHSRSPQPANVLVSDPDSASPVVKIAVRRALGCSWHS